MELDLLWKDFHLWENELVLQREGLVPQGKELNL